MLNQPATTVAGIVRETIEFNRLPWIRPLVHAVATDYDSVRTLFPGNPAHDDTWRAAIARTTAAARLRLEAASAVAAQQERRGAPAAARQSARRLTDPSCVAIVTGQQAGLFGGPLYSLLKAVTTVRLARHVEATHGIPVVPVFWVESEDHDWEEVRTAHVLDRESSVSEVRLEPWPGCGVLPVAALPLDERVRRAIAELGEQLLPTEFTGNLLDQLTTRYAPGVDLGAAFAGWLEDLTGEHGLVVFESADPSVKPAVAPIFAEELSHPGRTAWLVNRAAAEMRRLGHAPQIEPAEDVACLFHVGPDGRRPVRCRDGGYLIGDQARTSESLRVEALEHPDRFSPNVLLRPIVQDMLFPTVCYVAGPSELAYQAQLGGAYRAFGVEAPLLASRASATLLDGAAMRFLERQPMPFEALQARDESALNRLLESQLPPSLDRTFEQTTEMLVRQTAELKEAATQVDQTLAGAVDTTLDRMRETLKTLQGKIVQASKKKDETLRRQFVRTRALAFPAGQPQERLLSVAFFVNRHGPALVSRLIDALPPLPDRHYILTP